LLLGCYDSYQPLQYASWRVEIVGGIGAKAGAWSSRGLTTIVHCLV
jgi:hypothetical protein